MDFDAGFIAPPRSTRRLDTCIEVLLIALLFVMPAVRGTVNDTGELFAIVLGALMAVLLAVRRVIDRQRTAGGLAVWVPIFLFVLLAAAQLIPLPAAAMRAVSPGTYTFKADLLSDLPVALAQMPITFYALGTRHDLRIVFLAITVFTTVLTLYRDVKRMRRLLIAITIIGAAFALLALAQDLTRTNQIYWRDNIGEPAISGPFVNHSHYGQFMNLSIAAAIALLLSIRSPRTSILLIAFILLGWGTIAFSRTRGGVISAMAATTFAMGVFAWISGKRALSVVCLLGIAAMPILGWKFRNDERLHIAYDVWTMSRQFGATGTGLGTFEWAYTPFDTTGTFNTASHADNEYVQMLAEMGFGGLAIVLILAGVIWFHWLRALRSGDRKIAGLAIGAGYGVLAVTIHSLSDFGQHLAANSCLSAVFCGLLINLASAHRKDWPSATRGVRIATAVIIIAIAAWVVIGADAATRASARWSLASNLANRLADSGWEAPQSELDQLRTMLDEIVDLEPGNVMYRYRRALYHWRMAAQAYDVGSPERLAAARDVVAQLNAARAICPTYGLTYSVLGQIELSTLKEEIGLKHLQIAVRLEPNDPTVWFAAGRADARRGDLKSANAKFTHAMRLDYSVIYQAIDLYLDELKNPDAAIELAGDRSYFLRMVGNGLLSRPAYGELAEKVSRRIGELVVEEARRDPTPANLAAAGWHLMMMERLSEAEDFFARALRLDSQPAWRVQHARVLIALNRLDEAANELQTAERQDPRVAELADARKELETARAKAPTTGK